MITEIQIHKKYQVIMIAVFAIIVFIAFLYLRSNYIDSKQDLIEFVSKKVEGKIIGLKDENRGSYYIQVGSTSIHGLPIAYEIKKYNIQIGDSVYKNANKTIMTFYKYKNGKMEKNCEFQIRI